MWEYNFGSQKKAQPRCGPILAPLRSGPPALCRGKGLKND